MSPTKALLLCAAALCALAVLASAASTCAPDCSGRGTRNAATGRCVCDAGASGADCELGDLPHLDGYCHSIGDPHYVTFGSAKYSYQGTGVFWLVKSADSFYAQSRTEVHIKNANVRVNKALFVRYGNVEVTVEGDAHTDAALVTIVAPSAPNSGAYSTQHVSTSTLTSAPLVFGAGVLSLTVTGPASTTQGGDEHRTLTLVFRAYLAGAYRTAEFVVTTTRVETQTHLNLYVHVDATWQNRLSGLCDTYTGAAHSTLLPLGASTPLPVTTANSATFAHSWQVACADVAFAGVPHAECSAPPPPVYTPLPCAEVDADAPAVCSLACSFAEECLHDVHGTCNLTLAQEHVAAWERVRAEHDYASCGGSWCSPCNGHGTCDHGRCTCAAGFTGAQCEVAHTSQACPVADCSGHGWCRDTGVCMCDAGWSGAGCATPAPTNENACERDANGAVCSGHGACNAHGVCECNAPYYGSRCQSTRAVSSSVVCTSSGDPHYRSFGGSCYSYQGEGVFYTIYSHKLQVQARHAPWARMGSRKVQIAMAVTYDGATVEFHAASGRTAPFLRIAGHNYPVEGWFGRAFWWWRCRRYSAMRVGSMTIMRNRRWGVTITAPGVVLQIQAAATTGGQHYLNMAARLDRSYYYNLGGLCGNWDGPIDSKRYLPRGASTTLPLTDANLVNTFGPSWHVPCADVRISYVPAAVCTMLPTPIVERLPAACDVVREAAEAACRHACTSYAQCVHDVHAACDVAEAQAHIDVTRALSELWEGDLCEEPAAPVCAGDCSGHGVCTADGVCACQAGFSGHDCSLEGCPNDCGAHGACNDDDGTCCCHAGWTGAACDQAVCSSSCSGHGTCSAPEQCTCDAHFAGATCSECAAGYTGANCADLVCPGDGSCSGHGSCDGATGTCTCDTNWAGAACNAFAPALDELRASVACRLPGARDAAWLAGTNSRLVFATDNVNTITYDIPAGTEHNTLVVGDGSVAPLDIETLGADGAHALPTSFAPGASAAYPAGGVVVTLRDTESSASWTLGASTATGTVDGAGAAPFCSVACAPSADCSGNGQCAAGVCICDAAHGGAACDVSIDAALTVAFSCIEPQEDGTLTALFSYVNSGSDTVFVERGSARNAFAPAPASRGDVQPETFAPGAGSVVRINFARGSPAPAWTLGATTAQADAAQLCYVPCPADCSGHGSCGGGICTCDALYTGADCATPSLSLDRLQPSVKCVQAVNDATTNALRGFRATFGVDNTNAAAMTVPLSAQNALVPASLDGAQPTEFAVGAQPEAFTVELALDANAQPPSPRQAAWTLGARTVIADFDASTRCPVACPADCSAHGSCDTATGQCACDDTHTGPDCSQPAQDLAKIVPSVDCVVEQFDGSLRAYFAYTNDNEVDVEVPVGANNVLTGAIDDPQSLARTTLFAVGAHGAFPSDVVQTATFLPGSSVSWVIGGTNVATASSASPLCAPTAPVEPRFECVRPVSATAWSADFSYRNPNSYVVEIAIGETNAFSGATANLGQPTSFGESTEAHPAATFTVQWDGAEPLTWTLGALAATATADSVQCDDALPFCPQLVSFTLDDQLTFASLAFSKPLALAAPGTQLASCAGLLDDESLALVSAFGEAAPTCTLYGDAGVSHGVTIVPSHGAALAPGSVIKLAAGAVTTLFGSSCIPLDASDLQPSATLAAPAAPVQPTAVLHGPSTLAQCSDAALALALDASSSLGGGFSGLAFAWSVTSAPTPAALASLQSQIAAAVNGASDVDELSLSALAAGTYVFAVTVRDVVGAASTASLTVVIESRASQLTVAIAGPDTFDLSAAQLALDASVTESCASPGPVTFVWSLIGSSPALPTGALVTNGAHATVAAAALIAGSSYTFQVAVHSGNDASGALLGQATHVVAVLGADLAATLSGAGNYLAEQTVALSIAVSNVNQLFPVTFSWSCQYLQGRRDKTCLTIDNAVLALPSGNAVSYTGYTLRFGDYEFAVTVSNGAQTAVVTGVVSVVSALKRSSSSSSSSSSLGGDARDAAPALDSLFASVPLTLHLAVSPSDDFVASVNSTAAAVSWRVVKGEVQPECAQSGLIAATSASGAQALIAAHCTRPSQLYVLEASTGAASARSGGSGAVLRTSFRTARAPCGGHVRVRSVVVLRSGARLVRAVVHALSLHPRHARSTTYEWHALLHDGTRHALSPRVAHNRLFAVVPRGVRIIVVRAIDSHGAAQEVQHDLGPCASDARSGSGDDDVVVAAAASSFDQLAATMAALAKLPATPTTAALETTATLAQLVHSAAAEAAGASAAQLALALAARQVVLERLHAMAPLVQSRRHQADAVLSSLHHVVDSLALGAFTAAQLDSALETLGAVARGVRDSEHVPHAASRQPGVSHPWRHLTASEVDSVRATYAALKAAGLAPSALHGGDLVDALHAVLHAVSAAHLGGVVNTVHMQTGEQLAAVALVGAAAQSGAVLPLGDAQVRLPTVHTAFTLGARTGSEAILTLPPTAVLQSIRHPAGTGPYPPVSEWSIQITITIAGADSPSPLTVAGLGDDSRIHLTVPVSTAQAAAGGVPQCMYWSETDGAWSTTGVATLGATTTPDGSSAAIHCATSHLSTFTVAYVAPAMPAYVVPLAGALAALVVLVAVAGIIVAVRRRRAARRAAMLTSPASVSSIAVDDQAALLASAGDDAQL